MNEDDRSCEFHEIDGQIYVDLDCHRRIVKSYEKEKKKLENSLQAAARAIKLLKDNPR